MTDSVKEGVVCLKPEEIELLARLEEQNRLLEADAKSLNSISGTSGSGQSGQSNHSRKGSDTSSQLSIVSATSAAADGEDSDDSWVIWGRIINDWDMYFKKKTSYVKELVRRGIPQHFRGIVWQLLCSAYNSPIRDVFAEYMKSTSPCEKVIHRDIARTYPDHEFFKEKDGLGQESLFNVMKAYSLHDREVGYCQGSGFIVGLLLMMMPEEEAFAVVVKLMQEYRLRELFKPSMAELGLCMYQLESLVQELIPELHMHFQSQSFHTSMYASSWFLTLFTTSLPLNVACRVMDVFISEGMEMIFKIGIAILQASKDSLICLDMEGMLKYFQKDVPAMFENDPDSLMNIAYQVKYNSKKMKKIAKEYTAKKSKENEEMIELRRLRTENRLLRQRIENLEQESSALADRLIQGQVTRAQEAEENFSIKRELAVVKQQNSETMQRLEETKHSLHQHQEKEANNAATALSQAEDMIQMLQQELMSVRLREAESSCTMKELKERIQELEESNKKMREMQPDNSVAHLQEELIAVKLREAEANLSMKELRQKVNELEIHWQKHLARISASGTPSKKKDFNKMNVAQLQDELMTAKLREADAVAELKEVRQKVMELESQNQVCTNQIRRQDEEFQKFQLKIEDGQAREKELQNQLKEEKRKYTDLETKLKEEAIQARLNEAEYSQLVAELKQKVAALESKNQEMLTTGQLYSGDVLGDSQDLQEKIADLQMEVVRLRLQKKTSIGSFGTEDEDDIMDMVMHKSTSSFVYQETPTSPLLTPTSPLPKLISPLAMIKTRASSPLSPVISSISPLASPSQGPTSSSQ